MPTTLFDYPLALTPAWEEINAQQFFLRGDEKGAAKAGAPVRLQSTRAQEVHPNLIARREPANGRALEAYFDEQKALLAKKIPGAKVVKEGKSKIGPLAAVEIEYAIPLEHPNPSVAQWHAFLARDGFLFAFCGTTTKDRASGDRKAFRGLIESWAKGT